MKLYHGSNIRFEKIDLSVSKPNKDFGKGFYLSDSFEQAMEMAEFKTEIFGGNPFVMEYEFNCDSSLCKNLRILRFSEYTKEWAEFVFKNRSDNNETSKSDYDIVIGPIANDKVGAQIRRLIENDIDLETFLNRIKYMKGLTLQYFFGTEDAISFLSFERSIEKNDRL